MTVWISSRNRRSLKQCSEVLGKPSFMAYRYVWKMFAGCKVHGYTVITKIVLSENPPLAAFGRFQPDETPSGIGTVDDELHHRRSNSTPRQSRDGFLPTPRTCGVLSVLKSFPTWRPHRPTSRHRPQKLGTTFLLDQEFDLDERTGPQLFQIIALLFRKHAHFRGVFTSM